MTNREEQRRVSSRKRLEGDRWKWCVAASLTIMLFVLLFMIAILEKPLVKREPEITRDIIKAFRKEYDVFETDQLNVEILFRDVDASKRNDRIYAKVSAETDIVDLTCNYNVRYIRENGEWVLREFKMSDCQYTILNSDITRAEASAQLEAYYGEREVKNLRYVWKEHRLNLEEGQEAYTYTVEWKEGQRTQTNCAVVSFCFDLEEGWQFSEVQCY